MAAEPEHHPPSSILHPRPLLLAGPTAVGKSEIALLLAEKLGGEIISVDSMQVYRGLDIGTAKPSPAARARVPHHLIDVVDLTEPFDAAQFLRLAHRAVADIQGRGRLPILCGGTGLYFKAFLEGLGQAPPADAALRAALEATPLPELLRELAERDPATYERIDRQNPRRVIRAIEVIRLTGKPFSAQRADWQPQHATRTPPPTASASLAPRLTCTSESTPGLTPCSAGAGWPKPSNSCSAAWPRTRRPCRRWVTGRLSSTCAESARCPRRLNWSKSAPGNSPNGR